MKNNSTVILGIILLFCVNLSFSQTGYLKIGDIKGESTERAHKDWIVVEGINQGLEQTQQATTGSSRRRSAVVLNDLIITKKLDRATPKLMEMCSKGKVIPELELDMVANGRVYYKITLNNVRVIGITTSSVCDPDCKLVDEVSISYTKITWEYSDSSGNVVASYNAQTGS